MPWTLLPHLTACVAGEGVMLLDLRQDRYFRLPASLGIATGRWLAEPSDAPPPALLGLLERQKVVRPGDPPLRAAKTEIEIPETLEVPVAPDALGTAQGLRIAAAVGSAWVGVRTRGLQSMVVARRRWRRNPPPPGPAVTPERLAGYHRARRLVPLAKNCLLDSLALDFWLGGANPGRHLVFGVTLEPFLAHCWLQSATAILNDNYDHVRRYTPILVV
jgi:hypothetical protein